MNTIHHEEDYFILFDNSTSNNLGLLKSLGDNKFQLVFSDKNFSASDHGFIEDQDEFSEAELIIDNSDDILDKQNMSLSESPILYYNDFLLAYYQYGEDFLSSVIAFDDANNVYVNFYKTYSNSIMGLSYEHDESKMFDELSDAIIHLNEYHAKMISNNK